MIRLEKIPQTGLGPMHDPVVWLCHAWGLPLPVLEFKFHPQRRWRFDYAWPEQMVCLEQEGGIWTGGRHTRGAGYLADIAKYNAATLAGWSVFRCVPSQVQSAAILDLLQQVLR